LRYFLLVLAGFTAFLLGCTHKHSGVPPLVVPDAVVTGNAQGKDRSEGASVLESELEAGLPFDGVEEFDELDEPDAEEEEVKISDPLVYWNKAMFHFNDKLYFWLLKPVATGYKAILPETARIGVKNFFHNIAFPIRFAGCVLQAKGREATAEACRFVFNSFFGVAGFGNPAKNYPHLNPPEEDPGQAFGRWGIGNGFYIVWPVLGPSTLRDSAGLAANQFLNPVSYVEPARDSLAITGSRVVNNSSLTLGDYEAFKKAAIDPYVSMRNGYVQERKKKVEQ
jgi:phospholipid-binding lipoprotein MlaA